MGLLIVFVGFPLPAFAVPATIERMPLTLELLEERLETPIQQDGKETIDLRQLSIDFRPENGELRDRAFLALQTRINRSKTPLNIDLSQSIVRGDFSIQEWGVKAQLVEEVLSGLLATEERELLQQRLQLPTSINVGEQFQEIPYATVFRAFLNLKETRFQGRVDFSNTVFLQPLEASDAVFRQESDWSESYFVQGVDFRGTRFEKEAMFANSHLWDATQFDRAQFQGVAYFQSTIFEGKANFERAMFADLADWTGSRWLQPTNFSQGMWRSRALFSNNLFAESLTFSNSTFEKAVSFRDTRFQGPLDLQQVNLLEQIDFGNARFAEDANLNVDGLAFESEAAKIVGNTGEIGSEIRVSQLQGNETVLRNLVRNFRRREQIPDANALEYLRTRLRVEQARKHLSEHSFRLTAFLREIWMGLVLSLLLLLSDYGTNFGLVLAVGIMASGYFGLLFWLVDRARRRIPQPILPSRSETIWMSGSFGAIALLGGGLIFQTATQPWLTLLCLGFILLPLPLFFVGLLYYRGRYHDLMDKTYFVEDGELRRLRLLIARLPIMPRFFFFRDRYLPILTDRRWSWLNYYDFSLNNLLKFGFNDIRLRDRHLPGLISAIVWYEWSLGMLYITLLFWTLSRTIPGLNLLIYLS
ncbi:pentapeptide repeat-containing protein [Lusitaniella coriacea]|uniref:pentapeptide repeat-containing protein n=1 Tax=Lusitaniella coriacea TaxID=1983105 RepID=UPI002D21C1F8|nr:pentapeptide repeat-containing protein [Lusitaniella coriacea]